MTFNPDGCDAPTPNPGNSATRAVVSLMQMTSEVSFETGFSADHDDLSRSSEKRHAYLTLDSPRGLGAWADLFAEGVSAHELPSSWSRPQDCTLSTNANAVLPSLMFAAYPPIVAPPEPAPKKSAIGLRAKRDKARAEALLRMLGFDNVCPEASNAAPARSSQKVPGHLRERKIRNRASVQRCRAKKQERCENLEKERQALRNENEALAAALASLSRYTSFGR
jgi:bZIP transcription factor